MPQLRCRWAFSLVTSSQQTQYLGWQSGQGPLVVEMPSLVSSLYVFVLVPLQVGQGRRVRALSISTFVPGPFSFARFSNVRSWVIWSGVILGSFLGMVFLHTVQILIHISPFEFFHMSIRDHSVCQKEQPSNVTGAGIFVFFLSFVIEL